MLSRADKGKMTGRALPEGHMVVPEVVEWHVDSRTYSATATLPGTSATVLHEKFEAEREPIRWLVPDVCDVRGVWCWVPMPPEGRYFRANVRVLVPYPAFVHATRMGSAEGGKVWFPLWWHQVKEGDTELSLLPKHCLDLWATEAPEVVDRWGSDKFWLPYPKAREKVLAEFTEAYIRALSLKSGGSYKEAAELVGSTVDSVKNSVRWYGGYTSWGKVPIERGKRKKEEVLDTEPAGVYEGYTMITPEGVEELRRQLEGAGKK